MSAQDPWAFETSLYERQKYRVTLAALPRRHFASGLEIGCSIGVLTRQLAARCVQLLALDVSDVALLRATHRCVGPAHIRFHKAVIPEEWPGGRFDLIVLSEVLYFLGADRIRATARRCAGALAPGGLVLLVNFLGRTGTSCGGGMAARMFLSAAGRFGRLRPIRRWRRSRYRIELLARLG